MATMIDKAALIAQWQEIRRLAEDHTMLLILALANGAPPEELIEMRRKICFEQLFDALENQARSCAYMMGEYYAPRVHYATAIISGAGSASQ